MTILPSLAILAPVGELSVAVVTMVHLIKASGRIVVVSEVGD